MAGRVARAPAGVVAALVAAVLPWWVIVSIQPRPNRVLFGLAEMAVGLRDPTPDFLLPALWVHGAIFASELVGAGLVARFMAGRRAARGWLWGLAVGIASISLTLWQPLFATVVPQHPERAVYWPEEPPVVYLLRDVMLSVHLLAVVFLPQIGGVLGSVSADGPMREGRSEKQDAVGRGRED